MRRRQHRRRLGSFRLVNIWDALVRGFCLHGVVGIGYLKLEGWLYVVFEVLASGATRGPFFISLLLMMQIFATAYPYYKYRRIGTLVMRCD